VVAKKSTYQLRVREGEDPHLRRLLAAGAPRAAEIRASHRAHQETLDALGAWLDARGVSWECRFREELGGAEDVPEGTRLVVAVGGDGTVLHASHCVGEAPPILGVNSDPIRSVGWLCGALPTDMTRVLEAVFDGNMRPTALSRLRAWIDDQELPAPALNDLLVASPTPASTSNYRLSVPQGTEVQRSSGVWVATAAGSTGALRAAGGHSQPLRSRRFQFRVREPARRPNAAPLRLVGDFVRPDEELELEWMGWEARVWIDGSNLAPPLRMGERLRVRGDGPRLHLYRPARPGRVRS